MNRTLGFGLAAGLAIVLATVAAPAVFSGFQDNPAPLPGFTHSPLYPNAESPNNGPGRGKELWVDPNGAQPTQPVAFSSPLVADVDRTPANGLEIVVAGGDAIVYLFGADGTQRWSVNVLQGTPNYPCTVAPGDFLMYSTPSAGDLDGSGGPLSIVVGYGTSAASACEGGVVALDGATGAVEWRYSLNGTTTGGTPYPDGPEAFHGVLSTPVLSDTDGDGTLEIGFGGLDRKVYLLSHNGSRRWFYNAADTVKSSPSFWDFDGDGRQEMFIGTDIAENRQLPAYNHGDGGFLYGFRTADLGGQYLPFGLLTDATVPYIWRTFFDQVVSSSPVLGDVLADNPGPEIVVGAGCYFPVNSADKRGDYLKIVRPSDGAVLQTLPMPGCVQSSAAIGDLDGNGKLDVAAIASYVAGANGRVSSVVGWEPATSVSTPKWTTTGLNNPNAAAGTSNDPDGGFLAAPTFADLDGNGSVEVLVTNSWTVHVLRGDNGQPLTCQSTACGGQLSFFAWWTVHGAPAVADVDNDGDPEVVIGGSNAFMTGTSNGVPPHGTLYVWTGPYALGSPAGPASPYFAPWPQYLGGPQHRGLGLPVLSARTTALNLTHLQGSAAPAQATIQLLNAGGQSYRWTATVSDQRVSISPRAGTVTSQGAIAVTVDASGLGGTTGTVSLGAITVTSADATGGPLVIPVSIEIIANSNRAFLPVLIQG